MDGVRPRYDRKYQKKWDKQVEGRFFSTTKKLLSASVSEGKVFFFIQKSRHLKGVIFKIIFPIIFPIEMYYLTLAVFPIPFTLTIVLKHTSKLFPLDRKKITKKLYRYDGEGTVVNFN